MEDRKKKKKKKKKKGREVIGKERERERDKGKGRATEPSRIEEETPPHHPHSKLEREAILPLVQGKIGWPTSAGSS